MNLNEMIPVLLAMISGPLVVTVFFYGGQQVLRWLETPDSVQALASFVGKTAANLNVAPQTAVSPPIVKRTA